MNVFEYVMSTPLVLVDPAGLDSLWQRFLRGDDPLHRAVDRYFIKPVTETLLGEDERQTARGVEQALIEHYGLSSLRNLINSIARSNPAYDELVTLGKQILSRCTCP